MGDRSGESLADSDPGVHHCRFRRGVFPGQPPDGLGVDACVWCRLLGGEPGYQLPQCIRPGALRADGGPVAQVFGEQYVQDGQQQVGVTARQHRQVFVGQARGFGTPRVDHDDLAAAGPHPLDPVLGARHGGHRPVGDRRVGADDHQPIGAVDIGDGHQEIRAVHLPGHELLGELIDRGGGVEVAGHQPCPQCHGVHDRRIMCRRIAEVHTDRMGAVVAPYLPQPGADLTECLVPADRFEPVAHPPHRRAQPVRIIVEAGHRRRLGADIPLGQHILRVAFDPGDGRILDGHQDAAVGLAQGALPGDGFRGHGPTLNGSLR